MRQISDVHKHTVTAGESKQSQGSQKRENWNQQDEDGPQTVTLKSQENRRKILSKWPVVVRQKRVETAECAGFLMFINML